jgi:PAS domain S-box-containing protein
VVFDPALTITRFNHAAEFLTDYEASEVLGKKIGILFPERVRDESVDRLAKRLSVISARPPNFRSCARTGHCVLYCGIREYIRTDGSTLTATIAQARI